MKEQMSLGRNINVGAIPEGWQTANLGEVAQLYQPQTIAATSMTEDGFPVFGANGQVGHFYKFNHETRQVVITCRGSTCGTINRTPDNCWITGNAMVANVDDNSAVDKDFFFHLLVSQDFTNCITGTGQPQIVRAPLAKFPLTLPPLPEQQAIAKALGDVDGLIASLEALIVKKRDIKQGAMQELLSGHRRTTPMKIRSVLRVRHGRSQWDVASNDGEYPILASGGQIGNATRFLYDKPSVLIGRKGTIDRPQFVETPFWTIDTLFYTEIFEPNIPKYVFYQFCMIDWRQYNEASGVPSLNAGTIENVEIHLHEPDEQKTIVSVLSDMDTELAALEAKLAKTLDVKQGMMQVLLTGEVRLV
jgi:type I restriction enzyme, S subunit